MNLLTVDQIIVLLGFFGTVFMGLDMFFTEKRINMFNNYLNSFIYEFIGKTKFFIAYGSKRAFKGYLFIFIIGMIMTSFSYWIIFLITVFGDANYSGLLELSKFFLQFFIFGLIKNTAMFIILLIIVFIEYGILFIAPIIGLRMISIILVSSRKGVLFTVGFLMVLTSILLNLKI